MAIQSRILPIIGILGVALLILLFRSLDVRETIRTFPLEKIGLGEVKNNPPPPQSPLTDSVISPNNNGSSPNGGTSSKSADAATTTTTNPMLGYFGPGKVKPVGSSYSKMLVVPRIKSENVDWIAEHFGPDSGVNSTIYVADDPSAPNHPPKNKGHEVMIYLSYIIDHYEELADINIFIHSHQRAWHNNEILDMDTVQMLNRLSAERVTREGYMNLRCHWMPGCPDWMHPGALKEDINKQEESLLAKSWAELFPLEQIPKVLAQPCCAQFALSRDRIHAIPKARYVFYRDWMLATPLSDYISGRIWEYVWHYLFTQQTQLCPKEHVCYCDGYGVCFGGETEYNYYFQKVREHNALREELSRWHEQADAIQKATDEGHLDEAAKLDVPEFGRDQELERLIMDMNGFLKGERQRAMEAGDVAKNRAKEVGRPWKDGDGF